MQSLKDELSDDATLPLEQYGGQFDVRWTTPDDSGTTHMSVVDEDNLAVSLTASVNGNWGSYVVSPSTGILLNNEMDDFSSEFPNQFDLMPSKANTIRPNK